ncbi:MAG: hypothetical protein Q9221_007236 [Calogaya cf. arnoldii]
MLFRETKMSLPPLYDTFLIREPLRDDPFAVTHNPSDIPTLVEVYSKSISHFTERNRERAVERLQYELALLYIREQKWKKALRFLLAVYEGSSWRREGWWNLLGLLREQVRDVARAFGDAEVVLRAEWEGLCDCFPRKLKVGYDFSRCLDGLEDLPSRPRAVVKVEESVSCCELLPAQVVVTSHAQASTAPIVLSHILISFDSGLKDIKVEHHAKEDSPSSISGGLDVFDIVLTTGTTTSDPSSPTTSKRNCLIGNCDLTFGPGTAKAISFNLIAKDAGVIRVATITSTIETNCFDLEHVVSEAEYMHQADFWLASAGGTSRRDTGNKGLNEIRIHPKPPKVQIGLPMKKEYLTDESVSMEVEISNEEDDDVEVTLEARFLGEADLVPVWMWMDDEAPSSPSEDPLKEKQSRPTSKIVLGRIVQSASHKVKATFTSKSVPTEAVLEIKALYHVLKEPDTPISKILIHEVIFDRPFEANFDFQPCIDPKPWPNYFYPNDLTGEDESAQGLQQIWHSNTRIASFTTGPLIIEDVSLKLLDIHSGAICNISSISPPPQSKPITLAPKDFHETQSQITTQKLDLDDRRPTTLQFQLQIRWRRNHPGAPTATTHLPTPNLLIPFGEPRVLASAGTPVQADTNNNGNTSTIIPLTYTIENPSTHVLNFSLTMETSDDFAFSGPKTTTLNLQPITRKTIRYNIMPLVNGKWITPRLRVLDTGFRQVLKVMGTGGMRSEKGGASLWVDAVELIS